MWRSRRAVGGALGAAARRSAGPRCLHRPDHLVGGGHDARPRRVDIDARRPSPASRISARLARVLAIVLRGRVALLSRRVLVLRRRDDRVRPLLLRRMPAASSHLAEGDDVNGSLLLFRVLGVDPPRFAVSNDELERAMKNLQKTLHPDKFSTAPNVAREHSADQASLVNRAYATLRDPLRRAKYMLRAAGAGVAEESGMGDEQAAPAGDTLLDPTLLMDVMETREAIERAGDDVERAGRDGHLFDAAEPPMRRRARSRDGRRGPGDGEEGDGAADVPGADTRRDQAQAAAGVRRGAGERRGEGERAPGAMDRSVES